MQLKEWKNEAGLTYQQMGDLFGVSWNTASRWASGAVKPRNRHVSVIREKTGGAVTANDFYGITETPASEPGGR